MREVLFEDGNVIITVQEAMVAGLPQEFLDDRGYYEEDGMSKVRTVRIHDKVTGRVLEYPEGLTRCV